MPIAAVRVGVPGRDFRRSSNAELDTALSEQPLASAAVVATPAARKRRREIGLEYMWFARMREWCNGLRTWKVRRPP
jgi:hypothetical protein